MPLPKESAIPSIFRYFPPQNGYRGVLSIPHSGEVIPEELKPFLTNDSKALAKDVDYKVDELVDIEKLTQNGIAVLVANIHRTCIDLNRAKDICVLNWKSNSHGEKLVMKEPNQDQIISMTEKYYTPYYEMIKSSINELAKIKKDKITFIDLHSMPSRPTDYHLKINTNQKMERPDFCVSDIEGLSCDKAFIDFVCEKLGVFSSKVTQNDPYFGGHVTRHVHANFANKNNIQIEINRAIYMDEEKRCLTDSLVSTLKPNLTQALLETFMHFDS
jgi:N-formylglutamate amidohydrolase